MDPMDISTSYQDMTAEDTPFILLTESPLLYRQNDMQPTHGTNRPLILVIEDNQQFREIFGMILDDSQYAYILTATVVEAKEALKTHRPHFILCDIFIPDVKDCLQFLDWLRAHDDYRSIPIGMMSCERDRYDQLTGLPFLAKPFTIDEVLQLLDEQVYATMQVHTDA